MEILELKNKILIKKKYTYAQKSLSQSEIF